jgi:cysteine desulfurase
MRSGTLPVHQIVGMGEAFALAKAEMKADMERIAKLRQLFLDNVKDIEEFYYNGSQTSFAPNIVNVSFNDVEGESLMMSLKDIAVSSGSACTSASLEPSYVLRALGRNDELAHSSLRFSFGRWTTEEEVLYAAKQLRAAVDKLRELSPLWEMFKDGVDLTKIEWVEH